jgi:hypothetical protein
VSEALLSVLAGSLALGLPVFLVALAILRPGARGKVVVLGAVTPLLFSYAATAFEWCMLQRTEFQWAFQTMWLMSFWPFVACAALGLLLSLSPRPSKAVYRFFMGFLAPAAIAGLVAMGA